MLDVRTDISEFHKTIETFIQFVDLFGKCAITSEEFKKQIDRRNISVFDCLSPSDFAFLQWKLELHYNSWLCDALRQEDNDGPFNVQITHREKSDSSDTSTSSLDSAGAEDQRCRPSASAPSGQPDAKRMKYATKKEKMTAFKARYAEMKKFCANNKVEFGKAYKEHRKNLMEEKLNKGGGETSSEGSALESVVEKEPSCVDEEWL